MEDIVKSQICVNVTDQVLDKKCEFVLPDVTPPTPTVQPGVCFTKECKMQDTTKLVKECKPVPYEECDVEIEEIVKTECKNFTTTSTDQVCEDKKEKKCKQDFEYVCQEKLPKYGYGHPEPAYHAVSTHATPHYHSTTVAPPLYHSSTVSS